LYAHAIEHEGCEEGKDTTKHRAHESVACNGRGGEHEVGIDDVVEKRKEDREDAETGE
jgi:hypothetical protein